MGDQIKPRIDTEGVGWCDTDRCRQAMDDWVRVCALDSIDHIGQKCPHYNNEKHPKKVDE